MPQQKMRAQCSTEVYFRAVIYAKFAMLSTFERLPAPLEMRR
jgi:hypothetical protein